MSSRFPELDGRASGAARHARALIGGALAVALAVALMVAAGGAVRPRDADAPGATTRVRVLRVCADPNNMPFSSRNGDGFENRLAQLVARDLGARLAYTWWPARRGFVRETLAAKRCDVIIGVPAGDPLVLTTRPYYRSSYVFVERRTAHPIRSLDDPRLRTRRIGMHFFGDGKNEPPPARALARRGIVSNIVGYSIYGNYATPDPPARLIDAVARGDVDLGIAWGPLAGYVARHEHPPLVVVPLTPIDDGPGRSVAFEIAMGVRPGDTALRDVLDGVLARRHAEIERLLASYGVPLLPLTTAAPPARAVTDIRGTR